MTRPILTFAAVAGWSLVLAPFFAVATDTRALAGEKHERILVIYAHGTSPKRDCDNTPKWVLNLEGKTVGGQPIDLEEPCHEADPEPIAKCPPRVCRQARKIADLIDNKANQGYRRKNIFLIGQSTGGWSSLLIKRAFPKSFNGVIATAPAYQGHRSQRLCETSGCEGDADLDRRLRNELRAFQESYLRATPHPLDAWVVMFHCDGFVSFEDHQAAFDGLAGVRLLRFPDWTEGPELACGEPLSPRYLGTREAILCGPYKTNRNPDLGPRCSAKRIEHCPSGQRNLCEGIFSDPQAHSFAIHSRFPGWMATKRPLQFIAERITDWTHGGGKAINDGSPCTFLRSPSFCTQR